MLRLKNCGMVFWLMLGLSVDAATIYVATNGVDTRTGLGDWTNAVLTISNAVSKATTIDDLVLVSNGEYALTAQINISSQITVRSWNNGVVDPTNTIVNGNGAVRCFSISHTGALVEGVTIFNGRAGANGAGAYLTAGTLRNCLVVSNSAPTDNGGGIWFQSGSTGLIDNCLIAYNFATNGGGIYFYQTGSGVILVTNCVMRNNRAVSTASITDGGGGVWMRGSGAVLADSRVYWNEASYCGGGIVMTDPCIAKDCIISNNFVSLPWPVNDGGAGVRMYGAGLLTNCVIVTNICNSYGGGINTRGGTIADCRIIGNQVTNKSGSYYGGGVYVHSGTILNSVIQDNFGQAIGGGVMIDGNNTVTMRNCLVVGNAATNRGGGVSVRFGQSKVVLENCAIVSNRVTPGAFGGGIYLENAGTNFFANCIIYFNSVPSGAYSNYYHNGAAVIGSYSNCCFSPALSGASTNYSANNITSDPQFIGWQADNYRLIRESPCVNAGVNRDWMSNAVDMDGHRRVDKFSGLVDMGCYEHMPQGAMYGVR